MGDRLMGIFKNISLDNITGETWKDVFGFEGKYQVSDLGRVKSLERTAYTRIYPTKILRQRIDRNGYLIVTLMDNGTRHDRKVHRLVLMNHGSSCDDKQCNHKDGNKQNNRIENLEWATNKENQQHAIRTGLKHVNGDTNPNAKLSQDEVIAILSLRGKFSKSEIANMYNVTQGSIHYLFKNNGYKNIQLFNTSKP